MTQGRGTALPAPTGRGGGVGAAPEPRQEGGAPGLAGYLDCRPSKGCGGPQTFKLVCPSCRGAVYYTEIGCGKYDCEPCRKANSRRRGARVLAQLEFAGSGVPLGCLVLSVPEHLREDLRDPKAAFRWRKRAVQVVQDWLYSTFGLRGEEEFGLAAFLHPMGEDGETFKPHLEVLFPLVSADLGASGLVSMQVHQNAFLSTVALDELRRAYGESLGVETADVHYRYIREPGQRLHRTRYAARTFPGWAWWVGYVRYYGLAATKNCAVARRVAEYNKLARPRTLERFPCPCCGAMILEQDLESVADLARGPPHVPGA